MNRNYRPKPPVADTRRVIGRDPDILNSGLWSEVIHEGVFPAGHLAGTQRTAVRSVFWR
jgi:hypothetical protein